MSLLLMLEGSEAVAATNTAHIAVAREYPPDQLALRIEPPKGAPSRWAADEAKAQNVIQDLRLVDEMPGGDMEGGGLLARNPRESWPDLVPFSNVSVYGPGVEEVASYRLDKAPESDGDRMSISPAAVGWKQALEDNNALIGPGFIDGDYGKWGDASLARRKFLRESAIRLMGSASLGPSPLNQEDIRAAILSDFSSITTVTGDQEAIEAHYNGGGVDIGEVLYDFLGDLAGGSATTDWESNVALGTSDLFTLSETGKDHDTTAATQQSLAAPGEGYSCARIRNRLAAASEGVALGRLFGWRPKVIGNHGLPLQGTYPDVGFTVSQMLGWAIPEFTCLEAHPEDLEDLGYVIQQAWFSDPGPMSQVVQELTKYELLDWFVFGGKRFQLKQPGTYGRRWQAYAGPSGLQEQGFDAARSWKEILVTAQDVDGSTLSVGPPGSGAKVESASLELTDPSHPAVRAAEAYGPNFLRRDRLDLGRISTPARMIEAGEIWLREANQLSRSGSATLSGYVMDDRGVMRPASQVRAGDWIRFPDAGDTGYRKIVRRTYEHNTRTVSVDLDAPPEGLKALLERMQASIASLALS